jgi:hypothetical protein
VVRLLLNAPRSDIEVERDGSGFVCTVPALQCDIDSRYVTLDVRLDSMPDHDQDTFELSFGFTVADLEEGFGPYVTQDRHEVRRYFGAHTTVHVMPTVCEAVRALIDVVQPYAIFRVTKGRRLPQKAMAKHLAISEVLTDLGYEVQDSGVDGLGRLYWLYAR